MAGRVFLYVWIMTISGILINGNFYLNGFNYFYNF